MTSSGRKGLVQKPAKPFVLSLSKRERLRHAPFDKHVLSELFALRQAQDER
jgi:hypothetical protein